MYYMDSKVVYTDVRRARESFCNVFATFAIIHQHDQGYRPCHGLSHSLGAPISTTGLEPLAAGNSLPLTTKTDETVVACTKI